MTRKIRILFLSANPDNTTQLRLAEECNLIDSKIQASPLREQFDLEQRHALSLLELQAHLLRFKPNIVHFSGHGSEKGALIFKNSNGIAEEASQNALSELFRIINESASDRKAEEDKVRCVVLNACYSLKQAKAISKYVDCVIGIADEIKDKSATNFASSFYQALGFGQSVQAAFELGRVQLALYDEPDQKILKLEHRPKLDVSKVFLTDIVSEQDEEKKVKEGLEAEKRKKNLFDHCNKLLKESELEVHYLKLTNAIEFDKGIQQYVIDTEFDPHYEIKVYRYVKHLMQHLYTGHRELFDLLIEQRKQFYVEQSLTNEYTGKIREPVREMLKNSGIDLEQYFEHALSSILAIAQHKTGKFVFSLDAIPPNPIAFIDIDGNIYSPLRRPFEINEENVKNLVSGLNELIQNLKSQCGALNEANDKYSEITDFCIKGFEEFFSNIQLGTTMLSGGCQSCLTSEFHDKKEISRLRTEINEIHFKS